MKGQGPLTRIQYLYRGVLPPTFNRCMGRMFTFGGYDSFKRIWSSQISHPTSLSFIAALSSGCFEGLNLYLIKWKHFQFCYIFEFSVKIFLEKTKFYLSTKTFELPTFLFLWTVFFIKVSDKIEFDLVRSSTSRDISGTEVKLKGFILALICCPFERVQTLLQDSSNNNRFKNSREIFRVLPVREYYRGIRSVHFSKQLTSGRKAVFHRYLFSRKRFPKEDR